VGNFERPPRGHTSTREPKTAFSAGPWTSLAGTDVLLAGAESILARCREIEPRLIDAEVLEHVVGHRPAQLTVRVGAVTGPGLRAAGAHERGVMKLHRPD